MRGAIHVRRTRLRFLSLCASVMMASGCERTLTQPDAGVRPPDLQLMQEIGTLLRSVGYDGPFAISVSVPVERGRRGTAVQGLLLTRSALDLLKGHPSIERALLNCCAPASLLEPSHPDSIDPANNTKPSGINIRVLPSTLNRPNGQSTLQTNYTFLNFKPGTDSVYAVPGGQVLSHRILARIRAAGHYHGDSLAERTLNRRIGTLLVPDSVFSGTLLTHWLVPEVAGEMNSEFVLREIGGPNDGDTSAFFSLKPFAIRTTGLVRLPLNDTLYLRVGGTTPHPNDFNDWGLDELVTAITRTATEYKAATGKLTRVNDMSLFYGGKFDIGRTVNNQFNECLSNQPDNCWGGPAAPARSSHAEHRHGTEVDINPDFGSTASNRKEFVRILNLHFTQVHVEADHYHGRTTSSPYIQ